MGTETNVVWHRISCSRGPRQAPALWFIYAIVPVRSHDFFAGVRELSGATNGQSADRSQDDPGRESRVVAERVNAAILEELSLEDRIDEEVRVILDAYQEDMRRTGASYAEMFKKVKQELARKYKAVL